MNRYIYLYTPWREQGLSYDAKVIENIALECGLISIITYRTKRKIEWDCDYIPIKKVAKKINPQDIFFSFEVFPNKYVNEISLRTNQLFHMVNYEYYDKDLLSYHKLYQGIFCKSLIGFQGCKKDGLNNAVYMPWILHDFPLYDYTPLSSSNIIKIIFNGGTGGYKERRNLESIIKLIKKYPYNDVLFTIKLTKNIQRWTKNILKQNRNYLIEDKRIKIVQEDFSREKYIDFLSKYDLNLAPSKFEGFGLTILEALYLNIPTITLNVSPMNEIVKHNKTGFCMDTYSTGYLRSQPINEVLPEVFLKTFTTLVKNKNKIIKMKNNIKNIVLESEQRFNNYFQSVFTE